MQSCPEKEAHVHPKIVDIKDWRTGKDQGKHLQELGHCDTTKDLWEENKA